MKAPCSIAVLISGNGSNLQALIDAVEKDLIPGRISVVISNRPDAYGLERARLAGIPAAVVDHKQFSTRSAFEASLLDCLKSFDVDLIVLAGFMRILSGDFIQPFEGRMLNVHPSLLPKYPGLHTHRQVLANGDAEHGSSVHFVTADLDAGPLIAQQRFKVSSNDTEESLAHTIKKVEHELYPKVVKWFAEGRLKMEQGLAWKDGAPIQTPHQQSDAV